MADQPLQFQRDLYADQCHRRNAKHYRSEERISGATSPCRNWRLQQQLNIPIANRRKISVKFSPQRMLHVTHTTVTIKGGRSFHRRFPAAQLHRPFTTNWIPVWQLHGYPLRRTGHTTKSKTATVSSATTTVTFTAFGEMKKCAQVQTRAVPYCAVNVRRWLFADLSQLRYRDVAHGSARIHGINASGQAVGDSGLPHSGDAHAFLWQKQGGMRDLGVLRAGEETTVPRCRQQRWPGCRHMERRYYHARL